MSATQELSPQYLVEQAKNLSLSPYTLVELFNELNCFPPPRDGDFSTAQKENLRKIAKNEKYKELIVRLRIDITTLSGAIQLWMLLRNAHSLGLFRS